MASQRDLLELIPDKDDLDTVRDPEVRKVLGFIFQENSSLDTVSILANSYLVIAMNLALFSLLR